MGFCLWVEREEAALGRRWKHPGILLRNDGKVGCEGGPAEVAQHPFEGSLGTPDSKEKVDSKPTGEIMYLIWPAEVLGALRGGQSVAGQLVLGWRGAAKWLTEATVGCVKQLKCHHQ